MKARQPISYSLLETRISLLARFFLGVAALSLLPDILGYALIGHIWATTVGIAAMLGGMILFPVTLRDYTRRTKDAAIGIVSFVVGFSLASMALSTPDTVDDRDSDRIVTMEETATVAQWYATACLAFTCAVVFSVTSSK